MAHIHETKLNFLKCSLVHRRSKALEFISIEVFHCLSLHFLRTLALLKANKNTENETNTMLANGVQSHENRD